MKLWPHKPVIGRVTERSYRRGDTLPPCGQRPVSQQPHRLIRPLTPSLSFSVSVKRRKVGS